MSNCCDYFVSGPKWRLKLFLSSHCRQKTNFHPTFVTPSLRKKPQHLISHLSSTVTWTTAMSSMQNYWQWKVEPVSPTGFPNLDSEVVQTWGLFEDDEVQQQKKPQTTTAHEHEKADELTRAEIASKLLQDLDEWIKEGMCLFLFA